MEKNKMIVPGLDISTANIGYTLVKSGSPQGHELIKANSITIHGKEVARMSMRNTYVNFNLESR